MNFTAIDFETANSHMTSACSIGIAVVRDNAVKETGHYLIKPYPNYYSKFNISVHGITKEDTLNAPAFDDLWPLLWPYIDGQVVVAHNAPFDIGVLRHMLEHFGLDYPNIDILCSCRLARAAYPELTSHRLNTVCDALSIPLDHHRADSDACGSAQIVCKIVDAFPYHEYADVCAAFSLSPGFLKANKSYAPPKKQPRPKKSVAY